jgi:hypothetical protein
MIYLLSVVDSLVALTMWNQVSQNRDELVSACDIVNVACDQPNIHEYKISVTATSNLDLTLQRALHICTAGSEILTVVTINYCLQGRDAVWPEDKCQCSEGRLCLHLKDRKWKQHALPKRLCIYTGLCPEFALARRRTNKANINAFTKLERQQSGEDQPSSMTSFRDLASYSHSFSCSCYYM